MLNFEILLFHKTFYFNISCSSKPKKGGGKSIYFLNGLFKTHSELQINLS